MRRIVISLFTLTLIFINIGPITALALDEDQRTVMDSGSHFFNVESDLCGVPGGETRKVGLLPGSKIFFLGDSLTVQSTEQINVQVPAAGFTVTGVGAVGGAAISNNPAHPESKNALDIVDDNISPISESDAIVIVIGTNSGEEDLNVQIPILIQKIREIKEDIKIFWGNTFHKSSNSPSKRNPIIAAKAEELDYEVIDLNNKGIELLSDKVHMTSNGEKSFVSLLVQGLKNSGDLTDGEPLSLGSKIYMVGSSTTVFARSLLEAEYSSAGYNVTKINAESSRSITNSVKGGTSAIEAVTNDSSSIADSDAAVIAIFNGDGEYSDKKWQTLLPELISKIRQSKQDIKIFVATYFTSGNTAATNNEIIRNLADQNDYQVIETAKAGIKVSSDKIHPTSDGLKVYAKAIINGLRAPSTPPAGTPPSPSTSTGPVGSIAKPIVGGDSQDGNSSHILSYLNGLDEVAAANAINTYIQQKKPESPFNGLGEAFVQGGKLYNVNPFLAVGHIRVENGFATSPGGWHTTTPPSYNAFGRSASESQPHTIYTTKTGRQRLVFKWTSWKASLDGNNGTEDPWFALINRRYLSADEPNSFKIASGDFATYISKYAPQSDGNNEEKYVNNLKTTIDEIIAIMGTGAQYRSTSSSCQGGLSSGSSGKVDPTGYAFPLAPQTQAVGGIGIGWKGLKRPGGGNVHHDETAAYDLFGPNGNAGGDAVYAIYDAEIINISTPEEGWCYGISIRAADSYYYFYGHLNGLLVQEGQQVTAGQQLGVTAQWTPEHTCAGSSGAGHLHIDRGCTINNVPQPAGYDDCRDESFIEFLSRLYERLPS